jgi:type I restriction enzyme S subunit
MMGTIGASTVFPADAEIGIMDSHLLRIQVKENLISPNFLSNQISNYEKISIQIRKMSQGGIMEGLNSQIIHSLKIIIPTLDEQKKILEIIESIQVTTTKVQYKLKQHQFLKKSLMQDLLTGKVRVKVN